MFLVTMRNGFLTGLSPPNGLYSKKLIKAAIQRSGPNPLNRLFKILARKNDPDTGRTLGPLHFNKLSAICELKPDD